MNVSSKIAASLLAGVIAGSIGACSKDLATAPADSPADVQSGVSLLAAPLNDDFANAVVISSLPFDHTVNTSEATTASDDPTVQFCNVSDHTVWYRFTPTANLRINANTVRSRPDQGLEIFTGTRGHLTSVACSDYGSATFEAVAGTTYYIMIGTLAGQPGGDLFLNVDLGLAVGVTIDRVGTFSRSTGVARITGTVTCSHSTFFEVGGAVQQRKASAGQGSLFATSDCNGVTRWEAEVTAETGRFKAGPAEVTVHGFFTSNRTTEERHTDAAATVKLRPSK
jgi:hypothetical protein